MANYLLVYDGGGMAPSEAEQKRIMDLWGAWFGKLGESLVDGGNPFTGVYKTVANDGAVSDGGTAASGYSIIKADSIDAAVALAKDCPVLESGAGITVYETMQVM